VRIVMFVWLFAITLAQGSEPKFSVSGPAGQLDPALVAKFVAWVEPSIKQYPPRFNDKAMQKQVTEATRHVVSELDAADLSSSNNQELVTNAAFIYAMAYNIDLGTAPKAKRTFELAIALNPDDRRANYLFGMFLASTKKLHSDALRYLERADELGEKDAQFTIGLLLVEKGEKEKGLALLESYAKQHPESEHTRKVIESIKNGTLTFRQNDG
jgi:tetratricopeptide (TPR) repeat protein